ncbi:MAG: hypothetical protein QXU20_00345 [Candidatus Woesearchaeota archaeon]
MFGLKVKKENAEKVKSFLIKNDFLNKDFLIEKNLEEIFFPIKEESVEKIKENLKKIVKEFEIVEKNFNEKKKGFRELLKERFGEKSDKIKKSFEVVGDIAIIEIPRGFEKFEKIVGESLLKTHSNIKTVLKKASSHEGDFRVQKYKLIAGLDKKETIYIENNCRFMLNVERVYFSTRLSSERLRIAKKVSIGEDVLVMFSGYGAYPITIIKHSNPRVVYAVELNQEAHNYAIINRSLNKIPEQKLILVNGDVRIEVPKIIEQRKPIIGLKSHWNSKELNVRLKKKPKIIEFYLRKGDLENKKQKIDKKIKSLGRKGIKVMLHQPFSFNDKHVSLSNEDLIENSKLCYNELLDLCLKNNNVLGFVVHPYRAQDEKTSEEVFLREIKKLVSNENFKKFLFLENINSGFFSKPEEIKQILFDLDLKNFCFDLAHFYIATKNQELMIKTLLELKDKLNVYVHIADTDGKLRGKDKSIDTVDFGKGHLDFNKILEVVDFGIVEVYSKSELEAKEMLNTYDNIQKLVIEKSKFSRIIMPLPKTGHNFLNIAFKAIRKNGIIHFYTFLNEKEIPKKGYELIRKEAKKQNKRILFKEYAICGQVSPRKYRVCFDFQVI